MWSYNYSDDIRHFGVLGMKWGVRRERETAYRRKLTALTKNKSITNSDTERFKYRNQHVAKRFVKTAATAAAQIIIGDILSGKAANYSQMSKKEIVKKLTRVVGTTAANVLINDALAKSASKRYTSEGQRLRNKKERFITKEDVIQTGITIGITAIPYANAMLNLKMASVASNRAKNEAMFNKWGQNILTDKVDNVIWQSPDLMTAIIDNRGR